MEKVNNPFLNILGKVRWPFGYLLFFVCSCHNEPQLHLLKWSHEDSAAYKIFVQHAFSEIAGIKNMIHNGDLVTRTGNDFTSESLRSLNQKNKTYSHCGIVNHAFYNLGAPCWNRTNFNGSSDRRYDHIS